MMLFSVTFSSAISWSYVDVFKGFVISILYLKGINFPRHKFSRNKFLRLIGQKTENFAELILVIGSYFVNFTEFIFAMGRFKRSKNNYETTRISFLTKRHTRRAGETKRGSCIKGFSRKLFFAKKYDLIFIVFVSKKIQISRFS